MSTHNLCFEQNMKNISVFGDEIYIFEKACFRNGLLKILPSMLSVQG